ncbi:hypothetical protein FHG64_16065 [Antarcticibacterium flavum]|uniref:Uncharacterized protein n=1 Tax=Antarcticibacterium flavum TaxID=2058175 RepID=A0A5B7X5L2_9FLAO|nr:MULTISPECIES: hypothetical protein [Antarcticibacterium]MCM4159531.1 hypothetical protein [Antarcticibacterium sp. W02-3]QCY70784.1 hypothetical protein FHG64_16065 [Antarcticibacterium flavum]
MDPYKQITREHVPTDDLLIIISERENIDVNELRTLVSSLKKKTQPKKMTKEQEFEYTIEQRLRKLI